jgi:general stress protein YciG
MQNSCGSTGFRNTTNFTFHRDIERIATAVPNIDQHYELRLPTGVQMSNSSRRKRMPRTISGGSKRGFAAMDPAKQREIASKGGKASHGGGRKAASSR